MVEYQHPGAIRREDVEEVGKQRKSESRKEFLVRERDS